MTIKEVSGVNASDNGRLLTPKELQERLVCGRTKLYELLGSGEIRSYRVGRLVRIREDDVERFLERHRYGADE